MNKYEDMSAFMDGESTPETTARLLAAQAEDPALLKTWGSYHLIGDALRNDLPTHIDPILGARVAQALKSEPTVLAPRKPKRASAPLRWVAGVAVAASCAGLVVFSGGLWQGPGQGATNSGLVAEGSVDTSRPSVAAQTVSARLGGEQSSAGRRLEDQFNPYLVRHSEYQMNTGAPGMNPYARLISHSPERSAQAPATR